MSLSYPAQSSSYFSAPSLSSFGSSSNVSGPRDFIESNTLIAKIAFLLLVIIIFFVLLRVCVGLVSLLLAPGQNVTLISGMVDATLPITITQDPASSNSVPIIRSTNQLSGIEFTWSVWIFIKPSTDTNLHHIFNKGTYSSAVATTTLTNNAPGLYLTNSNTLVIQMDTVSIPAQSATASTQSITIPNMPVNKWFHVTIKLIDIYLDAYINGRLTKSVTLPAVPNQNYDDVNVCMNKGFNGYISDLKYFNTAIGTTEINDIVSTGPNTSINSSDLKTNLPPYLSINWYDGQIPASSS